MPTVEGDTVVMAKQNTNYIFNKVRDLAKGGSVPELFKYLGEIDSILKEHSQAKNPTEFSTIEHIEKALEVRAAFWVKKCTTEQAIGRKAGQTKNMFENDTHGQDIFNLSKAHMIYMIFKISRMHV